VGWSDWLVDAVSLSVIPGDIGSLQRAADVTNASNPTLPLESRLLLLGSDLSLVEVVVRACLAYDDIQSGRDVMWHLVECTPVRSKVPIASDVSAGGLVGSWYRKLDAIELALTASEVLKSYVHSPPLSILTKSDELQDTQTTRYKEQLLQDCELLIGRLEQYYGQGTCTASSLMLSQALLLKICSVFIRKDRSDPRVWQQLLTDVLELDSVEFFRSPITEAHSTMSWIGALILHCFVHCCSESISMDCKYYTAAVQDVLRENPEHEKLGPLSIYLINHFNVTPDLCQRVILNECRCTFNSLEGFLSNRSEFERCDYLLSLIAPVMDVDSEMFSERCVHCVAGLMRHIALDMKPSSLRSKLSESPETFIFTLLMEQPFAYYTLLDVQYDLSHDSGPSSPDSQSCGASSESITPKSTVRDRLSSAVDFATLLIHASNQRYSEIERSAELMKIIIHLTKTAMAVGDLEGAVDYCIYILRGQSYPTLDMVQQQAVADLVSVVVRFLQDTKVDELSFDPKAKISELQLLLMKNSNAELLTSLLTPPAVPTSNPCDSFQQGKALLYRIVALMLHGGESYTTDDAAISGDSSIRDLLRLSAIPLLKQELMCTFIIQEEYSAIAELFDSIVRDMRKKLSKVESLSISDSSLDSSVRLDESMVGKLVGKGFSRNGAKRSILSTGGVSLEAALAWAIEHSLDRDFENPIAQSVKGALLSNESGSELSSAIIAQNLKQIIKFIEDVDYECRLVFNGFTETLPSESRVKSTNKRNPSALRRKQSMGARRLSDAESITFDTDIVSELVMDVVAELVMENSPASVDTDGPSVIQSTSINAVVNIKHVDCLQVVEESGQTVASDKRLEEAHIEAVVDPPHAENIIEILTHDEGHINTDHMLSDADSAVEVLNNNVNEAEDIILIGATTIEDLSNISVAIESEKSNELNFSASTDPPTIAHVTSSEVSGWSDIDIEFDDDIAEEAPSGPSLVVIESLLLSMFEVAEEDIWFNLNRAATYITCFDSFACITETQTDVVDKDVQDNDSFSMVMLQILRLCCLVAESANPQGLLVVLELLESVTDADFHIWFAGQMDGRIFTSIVIEDCNCLLQKCPGPSKEFSCWLMTATNFKVTYAKQKQKDMKVKNHEEIFARDPFRCIAILLCTLFQS